MSGAIYKAILCPTDFSDAARASILEALQLAEKTGATLTLLHVIRGTALDEENDPEMQAFHEELEEKARQQMEMLVPEEHREGIQCSIVRGNPVEEILRAVQQSAPDLLVIGSHGLTGVGGGPFGSTGQALVVLSPIPVLVIKPEGYRPEIPTP